MTDENLEHVVLVIPAFEPSEALIQTIESCLAEGFGRVVIVDDGSGPSFQPVFDECRRFSEVTLLTNQQNEGKGYSLKRAFAYVDKHFRDEIGIVTADADGQHLPIDIRRVGLELTERSEVNDPAVIFGSRDFSLPEIPARSRIGNRATTALVKTLYGTKILDTQTGLRGIPVSHLASLRHVKGSRFEYEMNMLLDLMNRKIPILELTISTVYHDIKNSQSHFRPIRDSIQVWFQILKFTLSSIAGAAVDISVYALIMTVFFTDSLNSFGLIAAVVIARICSGLTNYFLNRQIVFADANKVTVSLARYVLLAILLVSVSAAGTVILTFVLGGHAIFAKILVDVGLYVVSFIVQKRWVFTRDMSLEV